MKSFPTDKFNVNFCMMIQTDVIKQQHLQKHFGNSASSIKNEWAII